MILTEADLRRFWAKVDRSADCWEWTASRTAQGYGKFGRGGKHGGWVGAHRVSYFISTGTDPAAECVCHRCDNPPCVNPAHLFLGALADNNADMKAKGRRAHAPRALLSEGDVRNVAAMIKEGRTNPEIAATVAVKHSTISAIRRGRIWADVTGFPRTGRPPWRCPVGHPPERARRYESGWTCLDCFNEYKRNWLLARGAS